VPRQEARRGAKQVAAHRAGGDQARPVRRDHRGSEPARRDIQKPQRVAQEALGEVEGQAVAG